MNESRTFEDIFMSLQKLAELREQEEIPSHKTHKPKCYCGRNEFTINQSEDENEDLESGQLKEPIYIKKNNLNFEFAVCPACNPRF